MESRPANTFSPALPTPPPQPAAALPYSEFSQMIENEQPAALIDRDGNLVVLESSEGWLLRFSPTGQYLGSFGGPRFQLYSPRGLAIDGAGNFYVADTGRAARPLTVGCALPTSAPKVDNAHPTRSL